MMLFNAHLNEAATWLMGFGLIPAILSIMTAKNIHDKKTHRYWLISAWVTLIGALGVFSFQNAIAFLIAWELMSFGSAAMLLSENKSRETGSSVLLMLGILEVGAVALLFAFLLLSDHGLSFSFSNFPVYAKTLSNPEQVSIGILLLIGFGAKLGLLPFYEWLPKAYASGSGATGAISSGIVLNAAFFGLMRGLIVWLPTSTTQTLSMIVILVAVITAILTILNAFQQLEWPALLSFSSAENAAISVMLLGVALLFQQANQHDLAALAGIVALIHLAGHALAKGALFLASDGVYFSEKNYLIMQNGLLKKFGVLFGIGSLFGAMSLCAMPPQIGFVSEWFMFQTLFHGFYLQNLFSRLTLIIAGAGMALTAAIALATFTKALGIGLLGANHKNIQPIPLTIKISIFILGMMILIFSAGLFYWMNALQSIAVEWFQFNSPVVMHNGLLLVPLSANFAFISPTLLIIVMPLLALIPIGLIFLNCRTKIKRKKIWTGGLTHHHADTTALTFSNALRYFYRFAYLPKNEIKKEYHGKPYFLKRVLFHQETTPVFTKYFFNPIIECINRLSDKIKLFQSGNLNFYNAVIGILFILILVWSIY